MKQSVLLIIIPLITNAAVIPSVSNLRSKRDETCENALPQYESLHYSYDATILDIYNCPLSTGLRSEVFDLNKCDKKKEWTNKLTDQKYSIPDALEIESIESKEQSTKIYEKWTEWSTHFKSVVKVDDDYENGLMSMSTRGSEMQRLLLNSSRFIISIKDNIDYKVGMNWDEAKKFITPAVAKAIQDLPDTYSGHEDKYIAFVTQFGTHVIDSAEFGALIERTVQVSDEDAELSDAELINKWQQSFPSFNDSDKEACRNDNKFLSRIINEVLNYTEILIGGNINEIRSDGFNNYWEKVAFKPALRHVELKPISVLTDGPKSGEINTAIKIYMTKAALDSDVRTLRLMMEIGSDLKPEIQSIIDDYDKIKDQINYDQSEINKLFDRSRDAVNDMISMKERNNGDGNGANTLVSSLTALFVFVAVAVRSMIV